MQWLEDVPIDIALSGRVTSSELSTGAKVRTSVGNIYVSSESGLYHFNLKPGCATCAKGASQSLSRVLKQCSVGRHLNDRSRFRRLGHRTSARTCSGNMADGGEGCSSSESEDS